MLTRILAWLAVAGLLSMAGMWVWEHFSTTDTPPTAASTEIVADNALADRLTVVEQALPAKADKTEVATLSGRLDANTEADTGLATKVDEIGKAVGSKADQTAVDSAVKAANDQFAALDERFTPLEEAYRTAPTSTDVAEGSNPQATPVTSPESETKPYAPSYDEVYIEGECPMKGMIFAAVVAVVCGSTSYAPAALAGTTTIAHCNQKPGDFLGVDGECYEASDRGKVAEAESNVVTGSKPKSSSRIDKEFSELAPFLADCKASGGRVFKAEDWNRLGFQPAMNPGQMVCHREESFN